MDKATEVRWKKYKPTCNFAVGSGRRSRRRKDQVVLGPVTANPARPSVASCSMGTEAQMNLALGFDTSNLLSSTQTRQTNTALRPPPRI